MQLTKRTKIIWGVLPVLLLAFAGLLWTQQTPSTSVPSVHGDVPVKKKAAPAQADKPGKSAAAGAGPDTPSDAGMVTGSLAAGNLGRITELRAMEEELELETKIAKLRKEKEEASRVTAVPALSLPPLTPPASPAPGVPRRESSLVVLSVQGVDGKLSATVRTGSGQVIVRPGSRLGNAMVTGISRQAVTIRRGGKTSALPFE